MNKLVALEKIDPALLKISATCGSILVSPTLGGRIFVEMNGELLHRFDDQLAANPDPVNFNNLGGNSLWPAPEGGDFAFNYPPNGDWMVQPAINSQVALVREVKNDYVKVGKEISLLNRAGNTIELDFERRVYVKDTGFKNKYNLETLCYYTIDQLVPLKDTPVENALVSAWSLEQFPEAEDIIGYGRIAGDSTKVINSDFYGDPSSRITWKDNNFRFILGGPKRLQIGLSAAQKPLCLGNYDKKRKLAVIRTTPNRTNGLYFNIADNDQANGPWSADDCYSIFNGAAEVNFHELETIAPMEVANGKIVRSRLESASVFIKGDEEEIIACLTNEFGFDGEFVVRG